MKPTLTAFALIAACTTIVLSGCNTTLPGMMAKPQEDPNGRPAWIENPGNGVSASAGVHIKGRIAQEELAIQRAREEYAKRFGVTIESEAVMSQTVSGGRANAVGVKASREETKQSDVKAQVKAKWRDPGSDVFWVWLVPAGN